MKRKYDDDEVDVDADDHDDTDADVDAHGSAAWFLENTYDAPETNRTLDHNLRARERQTEECQVQISLPSTPSTFGRLPFELWNQIILQLDLESIYNFREVNRHAYMIVKALPAIKHVFDVFRGLVVTRCASQVTYQALLDKLRTAECENCGEFGGYLYVLTFSRLCFRCLTGVEKYLALDVVHAARKFSLHNELIEPLPSMRSLPGVYSLSEMFISTAHTLVNYKAALRAGLAFHRSRENMKRSTVIMVRHPRGLYDRLPKRRSLAIRDHIWEHGHRSVYHAELAAYTDLKTMEFKKGKISMLPIEQLVSKWHFHQQALQFAASIRCPWLDPSNPLEPTWGRHCKACAASFRDDFGATSYRRFTLSSFIEHVEKYGPLKDGKHVK